MCGAENAFSHISIEGERIAVHEQGRTKKLRSAQVIKFDEEWFSAKPRKVLLFDDVVTSGRSLNIFTKSIETMGAEVVGAFCMGKTLMKPSQPTPEL